MQPQGLNQTSSLVFAKNVGFFFPAPLEVWALRKLSSVSREDVLSKPETLPAPPLHPNPVWRRVGILFSPSLIFPHAHLYTLTHPTGMSGSERGRASECCVMGCPMGEAAQRPVGGSGLGPPMGEWGRAADLPGTMPHCDGPLQLQAPREGDPVGGTQPQGLSEMSPSILEMRGLPRVTSGCPEPRTGTQTHRQLTWGSGQVPSPSGSPEVTVMGRRP